MKASLSKMADGGRIEDYANGEVFAVLSKGLEGMIL